MTYLRTNEDLLYPDRLLYQLVREYSDGTLQEKRVFHRARVEDVAAEEGELESNPPCPIGSVRARVYTYGLDATIPSDALIVFYPLFSPGKSPSVQPGEHVNVVFEDDSYSSGYWVSKVPNYTDINYSDPDVDEESAEPNSAQAFEGKSPNSTKMSPEQRYGGINARGGEQKRVIKTFEQQDGSFWENKRVLLIGESTAGTVFGTNELQKILLSSEFGARSYPPPSFEAGSTVADWLGNKLDGAIREKNPDVLIITLGGNDGVKKASQFRNNNQGTINTFQKQVQKLYQQAKSRVSEVMWVGPVEIFQGTLPAVETEERLKISRIGRDKAVEIISNVVPDDKFLDSSTIAVNPKDRRDGVHFSNKDPNPDANALARAVANKFNSL